MIAIAHLPPAMSYSQLQRISRSTYPTVLKKSGDFREFCGLTLLYFGLAREAYCCLEKLLLRGSIPTTKRAFAGICLFNRANYGTKQLLCTLDQRFQHGDPQSESTAQFQE
jgi:hypothetical protein